VRTPASETGTIQAPHDSLVHKFREQINRDSILTTNSRGLNTEPVPVAKGGGSDVHGRGAPSFVVVWSVF